MKRAAAAVVACLLLWACNLSSGDPRGATLKFLRAVSSSDTLGILRGITVQAPYSIVSDSGLDDLGPRKDTVMVARLVHELSKGGEVHGRWTTQRMVVGDVEQSGDSAWVEVTRLDQIKGQSFYNKFGLIKNRGVWQIFSFATQAGPVP